MRFPVRRDRARCSPWRCPPRGSDRVRTTRSSGARAPVDRRPREASIRTAGSRFLPRVFPRPAATSKDAYSARHFVELRMPIRLVVAGIEKRAGVAWRRCDDRARRYNPERDRFTAARVYVSCILHSLLVVGGVHAPRMFVRSAMTGLREHLPEW